MVKSNTDKIAVTQIGSPIGREESQRQTLIGLGLNKINRKKILLNNAATQGMLRKVKHLIKVEAV